MAPNKDFLEGLFSDEGYFSFGNIFQLRPDAYQLFSTLSVFQTKRITNYEPKIFLKDWPHLQPNMSKLRWPPALFPFVL